MDEPSPAALRLGERKGLPDDIAFLRANYPRGDWRVHANFGQLSELWLHVHGSQRLEGREVSRIVDAFRDRKLDEDQFQRAFVPRLNGFLQHLDQHHWNEDVEFFPKFRQLDERLVVGFDLLEADHGLIHQRILTTVEHARGLLNALSSPGEAARRAADVYAAEAEILLDLLLKHLSDEEELVIPAMLKHGERPLL
jgi:hemerythrin-like domain-containing protein